MFAVCAEVRREASTFWKLVVVVVSEEVWSAALARLTTAPVMRSSRVLVPAPPSREVSVLR